MVNFPIVKTAARQDTSSTATSTCVTTADSNLSSGDVSCLTDAELAIEAERLFRDDQLLAGARLLRRVQDANLITDELRHFLELATISERIRKDLTEPTSEGWTKQGESHGNRDFTTYYKIEDGGKLKCRIESVIESSLYVPFLAVMNETELYDTWVPKWRFPFKLGISRSKKLAQRARLDQVVQLTVDLPWPMNKREIVFWGFAEEDGMANRNVGAKLQSVGEGFDNGLVPSVDRGVVRMDFEADFLFRPCPEDHSALDKTEGKYPEGESKILLTFVMYCDPKVSFVPHSFMNFCTRTAVGTVWRMILHVAEQVRAGERPVHAEVIAHKRDFYDWVEERSAYITGDYGPPPKVHS
jgi:hypothetical protein